ncbi:MAG: UDP-glucose 4-epimerase GalE [Phormidesmis sp. RL_2_1]|nr:UDP-glucose 4-epimerase GalE [Phormidesmis sp. RL_2_1]
MKQSTVLVTGGAGYIGSHAVRQLQQAGYNVLILDSLVYGHRDIVDNVLKAELVVGDICDRALLDNIFATRDITAVIHFAAYAYVGESVQDPAKYYSNNVIGSLTLLQAMIAANVKKLVFSSTCATYGIPTQVPVTEDQRQLPINPYGQTKLTVEKIIDDFHRAYGLQAVSFRYFNAAGAHPDGDLGEDHAPEPHLIPLILYAALGKGKDISIFGTDYPTPDGTCIRDYVHVVDLARAHVMGLEYLMAGGETNCFNLGTSHGSSVREIIETARQITGQPIKVTACDRRPGDPPALVGDYTKASEVLGWEPQYSDMKTILRDAWAWHQHRHGNLAEGKLRNTAETQAETQAETKTKIKQSLTTADRLAAYSQNQSDTPLDTPLVSIIIPAYNAARFIERTLRSVLNQTYHHIEVLVIDDGSTDNTADIVKRFAAADHRVQLLCQTNAGVAAARNHGIKRAQGDFIAPIDADDIWHKTNVEKQLQVLMNADETVGMVYSWSVDIDEADQLTGWVRVSPYHGNIYPALLFENLIGHASATMIRRSCLETVGDYSTALLAQKAQGCEDWEIYLRIAQRYQVAVVPEMLVGYRQVTGSMSTKTGAMARSRALTLASVGQQFPHVYRKITQWCDSKVAFSMAKQNLLSGDTAAAWQAYQQALRQDPWLMLSAYATYMMALRIGWRTLQAAIRSNSFNSNSFNSSRFNSSRFNQVHSKQSKLQQQTHKAPVWAPAASRDPSLAVRSRIYIGFSLALLFPERLMTTIRLRWVSRQVCPQRPVPEMLPVTAVHQPRLATRLKAKRADRRVGFLHDVGRGAIAD